MTKLNKKYLFSTCLLSIFGAASLFASSSIPESVINVDVAKEKAKIAPSMYGIFFEDINRAADGGIYAELIFNRGFEESNLPSSCTYNPVDKRVYAPLKPVYSSPERLRSWSIPWNIEDTHPGWSIATGDGTSYKMNVAETKPLNVEDSKSMYINIDKYVAPLRLVNTGFYGLAVSDSKKYDVVVYLCTQKNYKGDVAVEMLTVDGENVSSHTFKTINDGKWHKYECVLTANQTMNDGQFALRFNSAGDVAVDYVSLFPQDTFMGRKNGFRKDVAQVLLDMKPAFMRWPGGCIVEGLTMENRVQWKNSIGAPELRKGEYNLWGYHSTNGFGYHEFLQLCEDLNTKAMFVCNVGLSCDGRNGDFYDEAGVQVLIQDALDAIEYAIGDAKTTKWGAERAKNGRKKPFTLDYIEVGNENHSALYTKYYNMFYDRIRAAYPDITIISCLPVSDQVKTLKGLDMNDPHFYNFPVWYYQNTDYFDKVAREDYKSYVGEFACNMGVGSGNMEGALSEGAFMLGMERNSDLVTMTSYAPLFENTKCKMGVNLILIQNDDVIGRSSYYVQRMFTDNRPDVNLATDVKLGMLPDKTSPKGGIGLGTYQGSAEFSNVKVTVDNKVVYQSDFADRASDWEMLGPDWDVKDGSLVQPNNDGTTVAMLKSKYFDSKNMTVEFDAVKRGGKEGFVLLFGAKDSRNCYQMTLGSFGNAWTIFQSVADANAFVLNSERPEFRIETNRPYHIKLVIDGDIMECWIDGKLNLRYDNTYVQRQYVISGMDYKTNEVIVKIINAEAVPMIATINLQNAGTVYPKGKKITLAAESKFDENTFENRNKIVPIAEELTDVKNNSKYTFKPYSMTVLRFKVKK